MQNSNPEASNETPKELSNEANNNNQPSDDCLIQSKQIVRRNALTPESHHIESIRQTEIQEKLSTLTMASGSGSSNSDNQGD